MIWQYLLLVMAAWNVIVLILYGIDKWKAKHDRWRISEAALLGSAFCLGGAGALFGMTVFRHKTKNGNSGFWYRSLLFYRRQLCTESFRDKGEQKK